MSSPAEALHTSEHIGKRPDIAVLGAGINGLATAILAQKAGYNVTIYTSLSPLETTSMTAGASFKLHKVKADDTFDELLAATWKGYEAFEQIPQAGVRRYTHSITAHQPFDEATLKEYRFLPQQHPTERTDSENILGHSEHAVDIETFHIYPHMFIPYLVDTFRQFGGKIVIRNFADISEIEGLSEPIIINATGLGSRELFNDNDVIPISGHIVKVPPIRGLESRSISGDGYIYQASKLGGTAVEEDWNVIPQEEVIEDIVKRNTPVLRHLGVDTQHLQILGAVVGLRPYRRTGIRLEPQTLGDKRIYHNYGHGGSGYTLLWGCAQKVIEMIDDDFARNYGK